jgi:hypothetical protein
VQAVKGQLQAALQDATGLREVEAAQTRALQLAHQQLDAAAMQLSTERTQSEWPRLILHHLTLLGTVQTVWILGTHTACNIQQYSRCWFAAEGGAETTLL